MNIDRFKKWNISLILLLVLNKRPFMTLTQMYIVITSDMKNIPTKRGMTKFIEELKRERYLKMAEDRKNYVATDKLYKLLKDILFQVL